MAKLASAVDALQTGLEQQQQVRLAGCIGRGVLWVRLNVRLAAGGPTCTNSAVRLLEGWLDLDTQRSARCTPALLLVRSL